MVKIILTTLGEIEIDIKASKTKQIRIRIKNDGSVHVTYPAGMPISKVEDFVKLKAKWIVYHSNRLREKYNLIESTPIDNIYILGKKYDLIRLSQASDMQKNLIDKAILRKKADVIFADDTIYLVGDALKAEQLLIKKLKVFAQGYFERRVQEIKNKLGVKDAIEVVVKNVKSWWGTCNKNEGKMQFNLRLISRDKNVIDSVIYHEFAHLKVFNHQKEFYNILLRYCPQYFELKAKTKDSKYDISDKFFAGSR